MSSRLRPRELVDGLPQRPPKFDQLWLWYLGDPAQPRCVGELRLQATGPGAKGVALVYAPEWQHQGFALSEDLPLPQAEHLPRARGLAAGAVDDARPDRWGERVIQFIDRPARLSLMEFLYYAGDERFGALGVSTSHAAYEPRPGGPLPLVQQARDLQEVVAKIEAREPVSAQERQIIRAGGSLGGAKPKALVTVDGEPWVIKFYAGEPIDQPLVEHATMTLAARAGIRVATTQVLRLRGQHALLVKRFDRGGHKAPLRLHAISAATALRAVTPTAQAPEFGYPELALLLRRAGDTREGRHLRDRRELFDRMVFNILVDNTDDHEKNHALLLDPAGLRMTLSPAFDIVPSNSGQGQQEFLVGDAGAESTLENAASRAASFDLTRDQAWARIRQVASVVKGWKRHFADAGVSKRDLQSLADQIDGTELGAQRAAVLR